jgi:hypothetical protein
MVPRSRLVDESEYGYVSAKQHCFVLFSADGIRASLDPYNFDKPKTRGTFRFGLKVLRGEPAALDVGIAAPRR